MSAIVMLTHNDDPRVVAHFHRLKSESGLPTYRAKNCSPGDDSPSDADIIVRERDLQRALPSRYATMVAKQGRIARGYVDILQTAIFAHPLLLSHQHVWLIESDVDFAGRWSELFVQFSTSTADVVTYRVRSETEMPDWIQWRFLRNPQGSARRCAFLPVARLSRRFSEVYRTQIEGSDWDGHFEATVPSIAIHAGLSIEDIGLNGEFSVERGPWRLNHATFGYRPVRSEFYFHERPDLFGTPGVLYHPVKVGENLTQTSRAIT
jgi:hypothetical protein